MKKVLFLMLFLVILGAASVSAQIRIGGDGEPHTAAVLDLNADDSDTPTENKGGLALPRVNLDDNTAQLNGSDPIAGMLVYNTNTTMGEGVYYWDGSQWVAIGGDGIVGNAVTDATASGGLVRNGSGTAVDPYTLGINTGGVTSAMIMDGSINTSDLSNGAVTLEKLSVTIHDIPFAALGAAELQTTSLAFPPGCTPDNSVIMARNIGVTCYSNGTTSIVAARVAKFTTTSSGSCRVWCFN